MFRYTTRKMSYEPKCIGSNASIHFGAELNHQGGVKAAHLRIFLSLIRRPVSSYASKCSASTIRATRPPMDISWRWTAITMDSVRTTAN